MQTKPILRELQLSPEVQAATGKQRLMVMVNADIELAHAINALFCTVLEEGKRFDDPELSNIGRLVLAESIIKAGQALFNVFEFLWSFGPEDTRITAGELADLTDQVNKDTIQALFDQTLNLINDYQVSLN